MTDDGCSASVKFETTGPVTVAVFTCKEISSLEQIDFLLAIFKKQIDSTPQQYLLLDFSAVQFVATSAINMLLVILKRMRLKGGDVCLCGMSENVNQVFNLMQLNKLFDIWPNCPKALAGLAKKNQ